MYQMLIKPDSASSAAFCVLPDFWFCRRFLGRKTQINKLFAKISGIKLEAMDYQDVCIPIHNYTLYRIQNQRYSLILTTNKQIVY
jgi:hypothetical protein